MLEMRVILPRDISEQLTDALRKAGQQEIGGILMGEHLSGQTFKISEITIQRNRGTFASFERLFSGFSSALKGFFRKTSYDFTRFNYLGEWHSHPSFDVIPSARDSATMREIVSDPTVGANFVVLMIVRLYDTKMRGTVTTYLPNGEYFRARLIQDIERND